MLDSAGKRVAEQGQLQFLAVRRERLDIPDGCRQRFPRARRSHRKRAVAEGGSTCQRQDQCRRRSRPETATWSHISRPMKHLSEVRRGAVAADDISDPTAVLLPIDCSYNALRPLDDLRISGPW